MIEAVRSQTAASGLCGKVWRECTAARTHRGSHLKRARENAISETVAGIRNIASNPGRSSYSYANWACHIEYAHHTIATTYMNDTLVPVHNSKDPMRLITIE